jgi:DNA polymerase-1
MEIEGFPLHADKLKEYGKVFEAKKEEAAKEIYALAGHEVNLNSPKQLADLLYGEMGLKGPKDGSTSIEALSSLENDESPIIEKILTYRKYAKLMGTYIDGLLAPHQSRWQNPFLFQPSPNLDRPAFFLLAQPPKHQRPR